MTFIQLQLKFKSCCSYPHPKCHIFDKQKIKGQIKTLLTQAVGHFETIAYNVLVLNYDCVECIKWTMGG